MKLAPSIGSASVSLDRCVTRVRRFTLPSGRSRTISTSWRLWNAGSKRLVYQTPTIVCVTGSVSRYGKMLSPPAEIVRGRLHVAPRSRETDTRI